MMGNFIIMKYHLIIIFFIILLIENSITTKGTCRDENDNEICCSMYHIVGGDCVECDVGTYRLINKHKNCVRCPDQFYGKRCLNSCSCKHYEKCDSIDGCKCKDTMNSLCTKHEMTTAEVQNRFLNSHVIPSATETTRDTTLTEAISIYVVITLLSLFIVIISVIMIRLYFRFVRQSPDNNITDRSIVVRFTHYARKMFRTQPDHETAAEENGDNDLYCDIRESAMIGTLDLQKVQTKLNGLLFDEYNHLEFCIENKASNTGTYNGNEYTRAKDMQDRQNVANLALPNYDKMEIGGIVTD